MLTIVTRKLYSLRCDRCRTETAELPSIVALRTVVVAAGWAVLEHGDGTTTSHCGVCRGSRAVGWYYETPAEPRRAARAAL